MWHAYLSQQAKNGMPAVNARDRIGSGPWYNQRGQMVARDLGILHGDTIDQARVGNALGKQISLNDKGTPTNGVGDMPNQHDILTGSRPDGTRLIRTRQTTPATTARATPTWVRCSSVTPTSRAATTRRGTPAHASAGCSQPKLVQTGGAGCCTASL